MPEIAHEALPPSIRAADRPQREQPLDPRRWQASAQAAPRIRKAFGLSREKHQVDDYGDQHHDRGNDDFHEQRNGGEPGLRSRVVGAPAHHAARKAHLAAPLRTRGGRGAWRPESGTSLKPWPARECQRVFEKLASTAALGRSPVVDRIADQLMRLVERARIDAAAAVDHLAIRGAGPTGFRQGIA